jgi:predicted DsbA family dithiol-disulfide isomerase
MTADYKTELSIEEKIQLLRAERLSVVYYTDPLCCWSWCMEPHWQQLRNALGSNLSIRYCMGGMIESWNNYNDDLNSISRPVQMGPLWMQATYTTGQPLNSHIWVKDPPESSYLACIAVKCAEMQSPQAGEVYLYKLREAVMMNERNIAKQSVLLQIAQELAAEHPQLLNVEKFLQDLVDVKGKESFTKDLQEVRYKNISRFPTLMIHKEGQGGVIITGYRPFNVLIDLLMPFTKI